MVSFLFYHSIFMTFTTPLTRAFKNSWEGKLIHATVLNFLGLSQGILGRPLDDSYLKYPPSPKTDSAFLPHAIFGLLWILAAYLHICRSRQPVGFSKRLLSYIACLAFVLHISCALRTLILDPMQHHVLPWTMLFSNVTLSAAYYVVGTWAAKRQNVAAHKDAMMKCFLYSIEGAGTIRTVGAIMHAFNMGPTMCQQVHGGLANACVFPYVLRLLGIRSLTSVYLAIYAKMQHETTWLRQILWNFAMNTGIILLFSVLQDPEALFAAVLSPGGNRTFGIFITLAFSVNIVRSPDSPVLRDFVDAQAPTPMGQAVRLLVERVIEQVTPSALRCAQPRRQMAQIIPRRRLSDCQFTVSNSSR